ncbi:hypothetical protein HGRIS_001363 [Hohenbuehelia grisea]|uniref:Uncharacterized protein n=1 Tax=Hohenbuehelia grisea TaxID=104357 RepID=A0ABR3JPP8_9AGAR
MDTDTVRIKKPSQRYNETYRAKLAQDPERLAQRLMSNRASSAKYSRMILSDRRPRDKETGGPPSIKLAGDLPPPHMQLR